MVPVHALLCFLLFSQLVQFVCGKCPTSFNCGNLGKIHFPFTNTESPDCGLLVIHGCQDGDPEAKKTIKCNKKWFDVVELNQFTIKIRNQDLRDDLLLRKCKVFSHNVTFTTSSVLASFHIRDNMTLFRCNRSLHLRPPKAFNNSAICPDEDIFYGTSIDTGDDEFLRFSKACTLVQLPIANSSKADITPDTYKHLDPKDLFDVLSADIPIEVQLSDDCSECFYVEGGQCRLDMRGKFYCAKETTRKAVHVVAAAVSAAGALGMLMVLAFCFRRRFCNKENPTHQIIEKFLEEHGHLAAKRYSYLEVKKVTNSFRNKLGQGGFGSVYKGKLNDGSLVAVKVLSELKGNGEEFINEVASISVTSHVNIVSLLGFCLEGSKRALIYEYMPNGSLEKFIFDEKDSLKLNLQLTCKTMYNIAIGVARGLEYLHRGCNTRILHFDIKPHNILLDEDFCPKISDFGLAKICPTKDSIISLFGARGTAGYIAPEVFFRNFGRVSHKSDVYSYGMMVLEIVGGRNNINIEVECSSEMYMAHWIHKCLQSNEDLSLRCIKNENDKEMVKKMIIVNLWCIQIDPANRPTMWKVVDMIEGRLDSLQIPPLPILSSLPTSPSHQQTQTNHT